MSVLYSFQNLISNENISVEIIKSHIESTWFNENFVNWAFDSKIFHTIFYSYSLKKELQYCIAVPCYQV